jgi:hypothetical protein
MKAQRGGCSVRPTGLGRLFLGRENEKADLKQKNVWQKNRSQSAEALFFCQTFFCFCDHLPAFVAEFGYGFETKSLLLLGLFD